ncbi:Crp/Fnr family transcriptional regulator [Paenibacillus sp. P25]|nr:Crp/Fnr family transcriptional regulator [Paenibacillus sp. P25]
MTLIKSKPVHNGSGNPRFLSESSERCLEELMVPRRVKEGCYVFMEGEAADKLYFVKSGTLKLVKTTAGGKEMILQSLRGGDFYGELGGPEPLRFGFHGIALTDVTVGVVSLESLEQLIRTRGDFAVEFLKWSGMVQRALQAKVRDLVLYGKNGAMASTLLRLAESCGKPGPRGIKVSLRLTNTELAQMIGSTRENVNRMLSGFKMEGVIDCDHGELIIKDMAYLQSMVCGSDSLL